MVKSMKQNSIFILSVLLSSTWILAGCISATEVDTISKDSTRKPISRQKDGMSMVYIPGDSFNMGSTAEEIESAIELCKDHYSPCNNWYYEREGPHHPVSLDSFWIDQTEISNNQYRLCVNEGACLEITECKKGDPTFEDPLKGDYPVVCADWDDANTYCQWVGGRLPTEAEWEYAFRGDEGLIFTWGNEFEGNKLNYCDQNCTQDHADQRFDDGYPLSAPVGSFPAGASWAGVMNMSGNVSEWVSDWFGEYSPDKEINPAGPSSGTQKMLKGCSWYYHPTYCRGAARPAVEPSTRFDYLGFRCVMPLDQMTTIGRTGINDPIEVPSGDPPLIDGSLAPGEWDQSTTVFFADGSELKLIKAKGYLYLGVNAIGGEMVGANIFLQQGDTVKIVHTSAALGTAFFEYIEESWQLIQDFSWRCRNTGDSDADKEERVLFLEQEGWLAANSRMGNPNELEYQILITGQTQILAVSILRSSDPNLKIPWPANLEDDCIKPTPGGLPDTLYFSTEEWGVLEGLK
ncbi:MAG: formylglycine-generating enzyme family protein [Anaerolineales bacterium]|nr:formylglycine-generating enzyme family protein [Anaerolineales bacterium]